MRYCLFFFECKSSARFTILFTFRSLALFFKYLSWKWWDCRVLRRDFWIDSFYYGVGRQQRISTLCRNHFKSFKQRKNLTVEKKRLTIPFTMVYCHRTELVWQSQLIQENTYRQNHCWRKLYNTANNVTKKTIPTVFKSVLELWFIVSYYRLRKIIGCSFYVKLRGYQGHQVPENQPSWKTWESFLQLGVRRLPF
jgi:hypothetical protein